MKMDGKMEFLLRVHKTKEGAVVAACDADILGKKFEEGEAVLDLSDKFFGGDAADLEKVKDSLKNFSSANLVGNKIVEELRREGLIEASGVKEIGGVKYACIFKI